MNISKSMKCNLFAASIAALFLAVCIITPVHAKANSDAVKGAQKWADNCARCHNMRDPKELSDEYWETTVNHMRIRAGLTGQDARDILAFLQASNTPSEKEIEKSVSINQFKSKLSGGDVYTSSCVACHGSDGKGALPGTPDFTNAKGPLSKNDEELLSNIINGFQSPGSPMAMPPRGGNASLTDADLKAVINYIRTTFGK
ncbi:cytochrome c5 family protein [Kangiella aquimarina]|uniref:C-type cytochrome n=1 Tax=Kangiella aquimarina TaxID=261965 RepID=A0ABZ0X1H8_9GAMM|nr:cytochrome c [Kangiella aquimarina]WQG84436.1 c-type cytochrome [Kangiella aquimarina]